MAITDSEGNPIDIDNVEDITEGPTPVEIPEQKIQTDGSQEEVQEGEQETPDEGEKQKITFDEATDDLLDDGGEEQEKEQEDRSPETEFYAGVGSILKDKGIITSDVTSEEDLVKAIEQEVSARLDKRAKSIEEYMHAGVPYQAVMQVQNAISQTEAITEEDIKENAELAKALIVSNFMQRGFEQSEAEGYYEDFVAAGTAEEKAMAAKTVRLKTLSGMLQEQVEKAKQEVVARQEQQQNLATSVEKKIEEGEILG